MSLTNKATTCHKDEAKSKLLMDEYLQTIVGNYLRKISLLGLTQNILGQVNIIFFTGLVGLSNLLLAILSIFSL